MRGLTPAEIRLIEDHRNKSLRKIDGHLNRQRVGKRKRRRPFLARFLWNPVKRFVMRRKRLKKFFQVMFWILLSFGLVGVGVGLGYLTWGYPPTMKMFHNLQTAMVSLEETENE